MYDKHNRCLLTNGEYDLVLHDASPGGRSATIARSPHKALMAQWETIPNVSRQYSYFCKRTFVDFADDTTCFLSQLC